MPLIISSISLCKRDDIVVTQDYGVAAMALGKGAAAIHQSGKWYTNEKIHQMLMERRLKPPGTPLLSQESYQGSEKADSGR